MDHGFTRRLAAIAITAGVVAALSVPSGAAAGPAPAGLGGASGTVDGGSPGVSNAPAAMLAAMERDLGLSRGEALDRLASDLEASSTGQALQESLGASFGGSWIDDDQLTVAVTDPGLAAEVRAAGAQPRLVAHSQAELDGLVTTLDQADSPSAGDVYGWRVDVTTNSVVVQAAPGAADAATDWVEASGVDSSAVRVETSTEQPRLLYDIIGGYPYYPGQFRCSIGFSVVGGFVTAGHCGGAGTPVAGYNGVAMGSVAAASFPGNDYGFVSVNSNWTPRPWVYRWDGTVYVVSSSLEAANGAVVCRSGSTTGFHCGQITNKNQTVNYPQGTVFGLTRTTVCAEGGDSGGSFIASGISAQGVTSGGSGNCTFGGITFFQPVNEILNVYNLTLVTG